jgi:hypothetical protein
VARGQGLVQEKRYIRTLVLAEESANLWTSRRDDLKLGDDVHIAVRPFRSFPSMEQWEQLLEMVSNYADKNTINFVVFDTLSRLWPVRDENDAGAVNAAVMPLQNILDRGAAVLLVHHPRKGDAGEGQASRGSGALPSAADILVEFRRHSATDHRDHRRVLSAYSRFGPTEMVIELGDDGYTYLGDRGGADHAQRLLVLDRVLEGRTEGITPDEVLDQWPSGLKPSKRAVEGDLRAGVDEGRFQRLGTGKKGDAFRYRRFDSRNSHSIGARIESEPQITPDKGNKGSAGATP